MEFERKPVKGENLHPSLTRELLMGFCLGAANIIPGVSGGTFLLIFQIYSRVFSILNNINKKNILYIISSVFKIVFKTDRSDSYNAFVGFLHEKDFVFLIKLIAGAVVAILCLSKLMKYLIINQFSATYSLFFGLILTSIIIPVKMVKNKKAYLIIFAAIGTMATIYISYAVNPYDKIKKKSELYKSQYRLIDHNITDEKQEKKVFAFSGKYTVQEYVYTAICGAVAVSAMVLPGISGSLVLILMGEYFAVVSAISGLGSLNLDSMIFLCCFASGIVFGGLIFARFVNLILTKFYNATMAFLAGLMTGSLYALWPFKEKIMMARQYIRHDGVITVVENTEVYTNINVSPAVGPQLYVSLLFFIIGCIIMLFFIGKESRQ